MTLIEKINKDTYISRVIKVDKKSTRRCFWLFLLRGISYPRRCLGRQCELFVVCVYVFCFFGRVPPTLRFSHYRAVHSPTLDPVETNVRPIIKELRSLRSLLRQILLEILQHRLPYNSFMVDLAGVEPASRTLLGLLHTAITLNYLRLRRTLRTAALRLPFFALYAITISFVIYVFNTHSS
jgi:hypothetical protein